MPVVRSILSLEFVRPELVAMFIHEMTDDECRSALQKASIGRLGCARDNQPYVVPIYFVFDGKHLYGFTDEKHLYGFTTVGQKIEWMRANPQICLEIDEFIATING